MKRMIMAIVAAAVFSSYASAESKSSVKQSGGDAAVSQVLQEWTKAATTGDSEALNRLLSNDYSDTTPDGKIRTKRQYIDEAKQAANLITMESSDRKIRTYGDTVVVTELQTLTLNGQLLLYRTTSVLVKQQGTLQVVASHASPVSPAQ